MKIAYNDASGHVWIVHGLSKTAIEKTLLREITDDEYRAVIYQAVPPDAVDVIDLPDDWVMPDYDRRNDWRLVNGEVVIVD